MKTIFFYYNLTKAEIREKNKIEIPTIELKEKVFKRIIEDELNVIRSTP